VCVIWTPCVQITFGVFVNWTLSKLHFTAVSKLHSMGRVTTQVCGKFCRHFSRITYIFHIITYLLLKTQLADNWETKTIHYSVITLKQTITIVYKCSTTCTLLASKRFTRLAHNSLGRQRPKYDWQLYTTLILFKVHCLLFSAGIESFVCADVERCGVFESCRETRYRRAVGDCWR